MDPEECKTRLAEICAGIVQQNLELMDGLDEPDFDPAVRLNNSKNNAGYKLTDFFDILAQFPHGGVPVKVTDRVLTTTDELIAKIRERYGGSTEVTGALIRVAQAFRNSKRIWRIRNPIGRLDRKTYKEALDAALYDILRSLDNLNFEFGMMGHRRDLTLRSQCYGGSLNGLDCKDANDLLTQIRNALLEGNADRKIIKGHERVISQNTTAIRESREMKDSNPKADPLTRTQRATVNEVKRRFGERRIANPKYSQLSVSKEVDRELTRLGKPTGFDGPLSLNHRVWLEIKREDIGLPPF